MGCSKREEEEGLTEEELSLVMRKALFLSFYVNVSIQTENVITQLRIETGRMETFCFDILK